MTTTKQYDFLNRLTSTSSVPSASSAVSFSYSHNSANQRTRAAEADGSYWVYTYDPLGQVISGHKFWSDESPVAGQQFDYSFDDTCPVREYAPQTRPMANVPQSTGSQAGATHFSHGVGNRTQALAGGDQNGWNERVAAYSANNLNQYTNRTVPGYVDIMGLALATNPVTVNGTATYRKGEYFREQVAVNNSTNAVWEAVTNSAAGQTPVTGHLFVPQTPESFTYDADGNLTQDGRWTYGWDAENRLTNMTSLGSTPAGSQLQLNFIYDYKCRRIQKTVSTNSGSAYVVQSKTAFLYEGWNLIAELNLLSTPTLVRSYVWGLDLGGTPRGAGGIGGLLETAYYGAQTSNCLAAFDGNGNIAGLVNASNASIVAQYEYGPFGEVIRATGPMAKANPFRFSTKYQDDETDLLYYGYRYYFASTGRWLSRDPAGEQRCCGLYTALGNEPPKGASINNIYKLTETCDLLLSYGFYSANSG